MIFLLPVCAVLAALVEGETLPEVTNKQGTQAPMVTTPVGDVIGSVASDGNYYEFHGIPYAEATTGLNRFRAPLPVFNFIRPFVANRTTIKCVRPLRQGHEGTEDCLVVNVFTPTLNTSKNLSVMVWIKGKEFDGINGQDLSFRNFVQKDVVVVSLNYRESIMGFLCLGTRTAPGNAGLKDIVEGLKWVKRNIAAFGGNPNSITLVGHGSGAAAVDLVTMSPMGKGLVQRAIAQSGNALAPWAVTRDNLKYALLVSEALGHEIESVQQLADILSRTSVSALMGAMNELDLTDNSLAFAPCVERKELISVEPFLIKTPSEIIRDGEFADIPMIFGFVDNEGTIRAKEAQENDWLRRMQEKFSNFIPPDLQFRSNDDEMAVVQQIRQYYFPQDEINENHLQEYLKYHGETMMLISAVREVRNRMLYSASTLNSQFYLYQFSYSGSLGKPFVPIEGLDSAAHSEELAYMFYNTPVMETPKLDQIMGNILVERWTNFAKYGNPTSDTSRVNWLPYTRLNHNFIRQLTSREINEDVKNYEAPLQNPHPGTITFWDNIYTTNFRDAQSKWLLHYWDEDDDASIPTTAPDVTSSSSTSAPDVTSSSSTTVPDVISSSSTTVPDVTSSSTTTVPDITSSSSTPAPGILSTSTAPATDISWTSPAPATDISWISTTPVPDISSSSPSTPPDLSSSSPTSAPDVSSSSPAPDHNIQEPDSASTANAYTFLIVILFSLLSYLHSSLILS